MCFFLFFVLATTGGVESHFTNWIAPYIAVCTMDRFMELQLSVTTLLPFLCVSDRVVVVNIAVS